MIKVLKIEELEKCAEVIRESFGTVAVEFGLTEQNVPTNGAFIKTERLLRDFERGVIMYGFFDGDEMVGFFQLERKSETSFELEKLAVLPSYRHFGYGAEIIAFCKNKVRELGGNIITIGIIEENTRLKDWYLANGFVHTGTRKFEHLPFTVGFMEMPV